MAESWEIWKGKSMADTQKTGSMNSRPMHYPDGTAASSGSPNSIHRCPEKSVGRTRRAKRQERQGGWLRLGMLYSTFTGFEIACGS